MFEKYDLYKMMAEIRTDEEGKGSRESKKKNVKVSQADIKRMLAKKRKGGAAK